MEHSRSNQRWHQLPGQQHPSLPASKRWLDSNIPQMSEHFLRCLQAVQLSVISYLSKGYAAIWRHWHSAWNILAFTEPLTRTALLTGSKHPEREWATLLAQLPLGVFLNKQCLWRKKKIAVLTRGSQPFPLNAHVIQSTNSKHAQKMKCSQHHHCSNSLHQSGMLHSPEN